MFNPTSGKSVTRYNPSGVPNLLQLALTRGNGYYNDTPYLKSLESYGDWREPRGGKCYNFDGVNDHFIMGAMSNFSSTMTFFAWINPAAITATNSGRYRIFQTSNVSSTRFGIAIDSSKICLMTSTSSFSFTDVQTNNINTNQWYSVAATTDGSTSKLYVDGVFIGETIGTLQATNGTGMYFGCGANGDINRSFEGKAYGIRLYDVVKSDADILKMHNEDYSFDNSGLHVHFSCSEESGTIAYNSANRSDGNGTLNNINPATFHISDSTINNWSDKVGYAQVGDAYYSRKDSSSLASNGSALTVSGEAPLPILTSVPVVDGSTNNYVNAAGPASIASTTLTVRFKFDEVEGQIFQVSDGDDLLGATTHSDNGGASEISLIAGNLDKSIGSPTALNTDQFTFDGLTVGEFYTLEMVVDGSKNITSATLNGSGMATSTTYMSLFDTTTSGAHLRLFEPVVSMTPYYGQIAHFKLDGHCEYTCQEGSGTTLYDISGNDNDGTIVGGTIGTIWGSVTPGQDFSVLNGGRLESGVFIPGLPNSDLCADGNAKETVPYKIGNPKTVVNFNAFGVGDLTNISSETDYQLGDSRTGDNKFVRSRSNGDHKFFSTKVPLSGADLTTVERYM